jgi:hypothetical protein
MLGTVEYSVAEMILFDHFGMADIAPNIQPPMLYTMLASKAFIMNDQTSWSDSLRRCITALEKGTTYRMTPEWDRLIFKGIEDRYL